LQKTRQCEAAQEEAAAARADTAVAQAQAATAQAEAAAAKSETAAANSKAAAATATAENWCDRAGELTTRIDTKDSAIAALQGEVATLQAAAIVALATAAAVAQQQRDSAVQTDCGAALADATAAQRAPVHTAGGSQLQPLVLSEEEPEAASSKEIAGAAAVDDATMIVVTAAPTAAADTADTAADRTVSDDTLDHMQDEPASKKRKLAGWFGLGRWGL
jgi:hypothetical protein